MSRWSKEISRRWKMEKIVDGRRSVDGGRGLEGNEQTAEENE